MERGLLVCSVSGHDKGKFYIVVGEEDGCLLLCNGKTKLLCNPKKKKKKHVCITGEVINLDVYNPLYDAHIRKELSGFLKRGGCSLG